jgi:hypothetical protein
MGSPLDPPYGHPPRERVTAVASPARFRIGQAVRVVAGDYAGGTGIVRSIDKAGGYLVAFNGDSVIAVSEWIHGDLLSESLVGDVKPQPRKHSHYFRDVSRLREIDVYRVLELFDVTHPSAQHAIKKLMVSGRRGAKNVEQDVREAGDTVNRWLEMIAEDGSSDPAPGGSRHSTEKSQ